MFCLSQDYNWWNDLHNWDGVTHWSQYMKLAPAYMGPNALPVPEIKNPLMSMNPGVSIAYENHFSKGDKTNNAYAEIFLPLFSDKVGLNLNIVPLEHYRMDEATRDLRISRDFDGEGYASGDLYIATYIKILQDKQSLPDMLLTINLRTASGNNLNAARYTDTPGYWFDLSMGKEFKLNSSKIKSITQYGMIGFYVWQTNIINYYQNDALLYGIGNDILFKKIEICNSIGGYRGYLGNGDRPMVYRLAIRSKFESIFNYELRYQQGINDFQYSSFRLALVANPNFHFK